MNKLLSTSEFAQAIGISESSVRRMADRGQVEVQRTPGGHRKIPTVAALRYVREQGIQPKDLSLLGMSISKNDASPDTFQDAVVRGASDLAVQILQTLYFTGWSASELFDGLIHDTLLQIGEGVPDSKRAIFMERRAISICTRGLMVIRSLMPMAEPESPVAICAAPSGDVFHIPSLMCSLVLHEIGFRETDLGANTPLDVIADAIVTESPSILSLSITSRLHSRAVVSEIKKLNKLAEQLDCVLIMGGQNADVPNLSGVKFQRSMAELENLAKSLLD